MQKIGDAIGPILARISNTPPSESQARGDSHLEEKFWSLMDQTVGGRADSLDQFEIGPYRVDAIFTVPTGTVVVELDGAAFHRDHDADRERDLDLIRRYRVGGVIRISYRDLMERPRSTLHSMAMWFGRFKERDPLPYSPHDDPNTANQTGVVYRCDSAHSDPGLVQRIKEGRRK